MAMLLCKVETLMVIFRLVEVSLMVLVSLTVLLVVEYLLKTT